MEIQETIGNIQLIYQTKNSFDQLKWCPQLTVLGKIANNFKPELTKTVGTNAISFLHTLQSNDSDGT